MGGPKAVGNLQQGRRNPTILMLGRLGPLEGGINCVRVGSPCIGRKRGETYKASSISGISKGRAGIF